MAIDPVLLTANSGDAFIRVSSPVAAASDVLRLAWDGALPVDPKQLARNLGLQVHALTRPGYSGWYRRGQGVIEYDASEPPVRQRFTIAHELGHHVLGHGDSPRDMPDAFSVKAPDAAERQANQFAAELLMPGDLTRRLVRSGRAASVEQLAKAFGVSKVAMTYRLNNLNISY